MNCGINIINISTLHEALDYLKDSNSKVKYTKTEELRVIYKTPIIIENDNTKDVITINLYILRNVVLCFEDKYYHETFMNVSIGDVIKLWYFVNKTNVINKLEKYFDMKIINQILKFDTSNLSAKNYDNNPLKTFIQFGHHNIHYGFGYHRSREKKIKKFIESIINKSNYYSGATLIDKIYGKKKKDCNSCIFNSPPSRFDYWNYCSCFPCSDPDFGKFLPTHECGVGRRYYKSRNYTFYSNNHNHYASDYKNMLGRENGASNYDTIIPKYCYDPDICDHNCNQGG
jgi:hypothetical protein